jgi:hypothetical protein
MTTLYLPRDPLHEFSKIMCFATVDKRDDTYEEYVAKLKAKGLKPEEYYPKAEKGVKPYETIVGDYNAMVDNGINLALLLLVGGGGTAFNTSNARLGVGSSSTAWSTSQADLVTPIVRQPMQSGTYPQTGTKIMTFKSDFAGATGDGSWQEWGTFNSSSGVTMLQRKVENLGTKSGGTWTLTTTFGLV